MDENPCDAGGSAGADGDGPLCAPCGTRLRARARFCDACGVAVAGVEIAEYKQVTVMFADVVHSMEIAAAVGPERLRDILGGLVESATACVRRYGGTLDKFTGDGIMALFGAPLALEDHATRACRASIAIQEEMAALAESVYRRDGVELKLRVGLSSGQVIAGGIASAAIGYTAIGEHVGMAQRMESAAPPGGILVSTSTARLVERSTVLSAVQRVHVKGFDRPAMARRLLGMALERASGPGASTLVGRSDELALLSRSLDTAEGGPGSVLCVVGAAGAGKSRLVAETSACARAAGTDVFVSSCESHATDVPFGVVGRLLRQLWGIGGLDQQAARAALRVQLPSAASVDLHLLDDLLGIGDTCSTPPGIDPDERRRRLTALVNTAQLDRTVPAVFVVEDVHWIDEASESMLSEILAEGPRTYSVVVITCRPEYRGGLRHVAGAITVDVGPLNERETTSLIDELLGTDPSLGPIDDP
ncbi:adenylate/guanylate cyclase domain-containing protein [Mycobacterium sp. NPDC003449]